MSSPVSPSVRSQAVLPGEWLSPRHFAGLLALLIVLMFWEVIFGFGTFFFRDFGFFGYPLAHYNRESLWRGELPFWNPLSNCGIPYLAQWNTMVFYPLSLFHLLLPLPWSLPVFSVGHLFLAGLGMYYWAWRWCGSRLGASLAGLTFAFNGLTLHSVSSVSTIAALAWLPWVLWRAEKGWREGGRELWIASAVAAVQMLAGGAEVTLFTWAIAAALALVDVLNPQGRRRLMMALRFGTIILMVGALSAIQLLPFLDFVFHSQRDGSYGDSRWSMPPWGWANLILPLFRTKPAHSGVHMQPDQYWTTSYYLGIAVVLLLIGARPRWRANWVWWAIGFLGLLLALGESGFIYGPLKTLFPAIGMMRFPVKFVILTVVAFPILAARALASHLRMPEGDWINACARLVAGAVVLGLALGGLLWWVHVHPELRGTWSFTMQNALVRAAIIVLLLGLLYLQRTASGWRAQLSCTVGLLVVCWIDLITHMPNQNPSAPRVIYARDLVKPYLPKAPQPELGGSRAMLTPMAQQQLRFTSLPDPSQQYPSRRIALLNNCNLLEDVPKVNGFYSIYLGHHADLMMALYMRTNLPNEGLMDFLGVSHLTAGGNIFEWAGRRSFLPVLMAGQKPVFVPAAEVLPAVTSSNFNPRTEVYLPSETQAAIGITNGCAAKILRSRIDRHELEATVRSAAPALMTIAQTDYHAWTAYVNGVRTPIWRANHGFQAVRVPAGLSQVRLIYREPLFGWGVVISAIAALICGLGWRFAPPQFLAGRAET